ncbi:D-mannonate oxidoreductase [Cronobacter sakazakii 696]|nr:D-mannonate oxidoreductase [Cronobacter sakazakii 696]
MKTRTSRNLPLVCWLRRRERGHAPFTVLSCDNIPDNGHVVREAVLGMAHQRDPALAQWIADHVTFPGTMVDRIVPAATPESLAEIADALGVADPCAISCEPFIQWVIEDNFVAGRPAWEDAGVQMVDDVLPWEQMKLRMLNGSHSFLAYLGYLAGYAHISDCMNDTHFRDAIYFAHNFRDRYWYRRCARAASAGMRRLPCSPAIIFLITAMWCAKRCSAWRISAILPLRSG